MPFCKFCGKEYTNPNAAFCPSCGKPVQGISIASSPTPSQVMQVKYCQKCGTPNDAGVLVCKNCGNRSFDPIPTIKVSRPTGVTVIAGLQIVGALIIIGIGIAYPVLAVVFLPLGGITLLVALGLFTGRNWARILMLVLAVLDLITISGIVFSIIAIWYLRKPNVVTYFKQPKTGAFSAT
jgi:hypothetical protein